MYKPDLSHLDSHSFGEELANSITHGLGALLALGGLALLVTLAGIMGDPWRVVSFAVYGATLALLYICSTLFHAFKNPRVKHIFRIFDHAAIYLLIAGTYTPFLLVSLGHSVLGWTLLGIAWGIATAGVVQAALALDRLKLYSLIAYLALGWLIVIAARPLYAALQAGGSAWLLAGGLFYTLGLTFYLVKRIPYNHALWHLSVLAASACHFLAMLLYVLPAKA